MRVGILQPSYLPWLGYFEQISRVDKFVLYDDVQYDKHGWRNRNRIKTANGVQWLTVPVHFSLTDASRLCDIEIDQRKAWSRKHLNSIRQNYSRAPYFDQYFPMFDEVFSQKWTSLVSLNVAFLRRFSEALGIQTEFVFSSTIANSGDKCQRLINICKMLKADVFYEGAAGKNYIDENLFREEGIKVEYQNYQHPIYPQLYGEFVSHLSIIDVLFNCGQETSRIIGIE